MGITHGVPAGPSHPVTDRAFSRPVVESAAAFFRQTCSCCKVAGSRRNRWFSCSSVSPGIAQLAGSRPIWPIEIPAARRVEFPGFRGGC